MQLYDILVVKNTLFCVALYVHMHICTPFTILALIFKSELNVVDP